MSYLMVLPFSSTPGGVQEKCRVDCVCMLSIYTHGTQLCTYMYMRYCIRTDFYGTLIFCQFHG